MVHSAAHVLGMNSDLHVHRQQEVWKRSSSAMSMPTREDCGIRCFGCAKVIQVHMHLAIATCLLCQTRGRSKRTFSNLQEPDTSQKNVLMFCYDWRKHGEIIHGY